MQDPLKINFDQYYQYKSKLSQIKRVTNYTSLFYNDSRGKNKSWSAAVRPYYRVTFDHDTYDADRSIICTSAHGYDCSPVLWNTKGAQAAFRSLSSENVSRWQWRTQQQILDMAKLRHNFFLTWIHYTNIIQQP